ncbi:recombination inhibitory protein MutS2 [Pseudanabaena sp. lw0831]|uniref:endonuclease MutS2 n=1 Tax=Pseudanabaena sp. lw0831 TaxID=1357935 RepID=UPI001916B556|nr:endonuclease MutS2 [Pseudanabaena sp. lw0831]GBO52917.1 recombination inhibitory protein MutS2 [Pseudanabaena sp. lw0831]
MQAETLDLLEWNRLCQHLSTFTTTKLGAISSAHLPIPDRYEDTLELLTQTKEAYALEERNAGVSLDGIQNITEAVFRAEKQGILSALELWAIATTLAGARNLRRQLDNADYCPNLQILASELRTYPDVEQEIYRCVDEGGNVLDRASVRLGEIRHELTSVRDQIITKLQNIMQRNASSLQEQIITQRSDRYVLSVKSPQRDRVPGVIHDTSSTGMTLFVEPNSVVQSNNRLRQLLKMEQAQIEIILAELSAKITAICEDLQRLLIIVTKIDLAVARARYGYWLGANPPHFLEGEAIVLRQLRHPLLVWQQKNEEGREVVPVDVLISPQISVVVITGPNTGGKTATLKTFGLAALMAKAGMFIPAKEPVEMPWFDLVLADIGDEQSLQQNLSTFSGHIRRIGRILDSLSSQSLVLLDEVGAGTDPSEGSAIATALLEYLGEHTRLAIATTHFGELKALKYQNPKFENASVEFDDASLAPTYRLLWGIPGRSNALAIAGRLGLSQEIIEAAQVRVGIGSTEMNDVIAELEAHRREQTQKTEAAANLLSETERLHNEILDRAEKMRSQAKELRERQEKEVNAAIAQAQKEVGRVIRKLQKGEQLGEQVAADVQRTEQRIGELTKRHIPAVPEEKVEVQLKIGDRVRIPKFGKIAQVLTVPNSSGEFSVRLGTMKLTVNITDTETI